MAHFWEWFVYQTINYQTGRDNPVSAGDYAQLFIGHIRSENPFCVKKVRSRRKCQIKNV